MTVFFLLQISKSSLDASLASNQSQSSFYMPRAATKPSQRAQILNRLQQNKTHTLNFSTDSVNHNLLNSNNSDIIQTVLSSSNDKLGHGTVPVDDSLSTSIGNSYICSNTQDAQRRKLDNSVGVLEKDINSLLEADTVQIDVSATLHTCQSIDKDSDSSEIITFKPPRDVEENNNVMAIGEEMPTDDGGDGDGQVNTANTLSASPDLQSVEENGQHNSNG